MITGATADTAQPLLASTYYLARALGPFADVRLAERGSPAQAVSQFIEQRLPMLILADVGNVAEAREQLTRWIEDGGVLVRFAGPRLAAADDDLVPVKLRRGGRMLGGSLSWEQPQQLAAFSRESPFFGMAVPNDVTVTRQVLAEPDATLTERTWATLADGTPLVTAQRRGKGLIVLFHVTADTRWSDLPLSGTFVDMLKRIVSPRRLGRRRPMATPQAAAPRARWCRRPACSTASARSDRRPRPRGRCRPSFAGRATADHPPGFYGPPEGLLAVNTLAPADRLAPLDYLAAQCAPRGLPHERAGGSARADPARRACAARARRAGRVPARRRDAAALAPAPRRPPPRSRSRSSALRCSASPQAFAQSNDEQALKVDARDAARLCHHRRRRGRPHQQGRPAGPHPVPRAAHRARSRRAVGLDPARDELAFFPLIYWPIVPSAPKPSREALEHIDAYMKQGGTVLFDTRDAVEAPPGPGGETRGPGMLALRAILSSLDIPELEPVPRDHVLTKTFFLLQGLPRPLQPPASSGSRRWRPPNDDEPASRPARAGDGVSSIIITSNDFAGAWAMRPDGQPMLPLVAGEPRQREFAFRAGVNIVMYTLTGNYKADQVHVPALLERLGQ